MYHRIQWKIDKTWSRTNVVKQHGVPTNGWHIAKVSRGDVAQGELIGFVDAAMQTT